MAEEPTTVAALSWILELPRDLGLAEDLGPQIANVRTELPGWEGRHDELPDWSDAPRDAVPVRRLRFRRAFVDIGMPTAATDLAFGHLRRMEGERRREWEEGLRERIAEGAREWKTVCQMTRWYLGEAIPDPPKDPLDPPADSVIRTDFAPMLGELALWLQAYSMASGQLDIGPLALHDVPAMVPWVLDISAGPDGPRATGSGMLAIHERAPDLAPAEGSVEAGRSASFLIARGAETFPFFGPISLLFQARSHSRAGRSRQAVIDMGTAVESLITVTIKEAMQVRGRSEAETREIFEAKWTTIYNRSLLETLGVSVGAGGAAHSKWWGEAYKLRNDVVHRGMAAGAEEAERAVGLSWDLFEWVGERLRAQEDLAELGEAVRFNRPSAGGSAGDR